MRVLAAYGLDDMLKLDPERTFVKSIFLLQILHPDDHDVPEDTIIHDLEITDVRSHPASSSPLPIFPVNPHPPLVLNTQYVPRIEVSLTSLRPWRMAKLTLKWTLFHSLSLSLILWEPHSHPTLACVCLSPVPYPRG